ncbi:MAG TPA: CheR family methyltransferase [Burkholderiaceae bacterium]|nr:CheR family methyltransferase [Burkholderiaceae bacterium]
MSAMPRAESFSLLAGLPEAGDDDITLSTRLLKARAGLVLGAHKRDMIGRVLGLRARDLGVGTVTDYLTSLQRGGESTEWEHFVNAFTINHTAFFREQHHFDSLTKFARACKTPISVWSCAASTGEEAYSIAMTLREAQPATDLRQAVWATDIDTQAIARARAGVYSGDRAEPIPEVLLKRYFQRGQGARTGQVRVKPLLSSLVRFDTFNLCAPAWPSGRMFDAIFCRNVMIYFDKETQVRILDHMATMLRPGGLLFAGHSENFTYLTDKFRLLGQTVYERDKLK